MAQNTETTNFPSNPLRLLLAEAAILRREGAHGAAVAVEADAIRAVRAACAEAKTGAPQ